MVFDGNTGRKMREAFKASRRRKGDNFWEEILKGQGLDVSNGDNQISTEMYHQISELRRGTGDYRHDLRKFKSGSFEFINVCGCLEHEKSILTAVLGWYYLLKEGGHMIITVPDHRLYEACKWPSIFNTDHKWSFSITASKDLHSHHLNIVDFLSSIPGVQIRRIHLADSNYDYSRFAIDQTREDAEADIEVVIRKLPISDGRKRTFKHSGARGDLIYSLPTIQKLGGGKLYINRKEDHFFGIEMTDDEFQSITAFFKTQSYIDEVLEWDGQQVDYDLDLFRALDPMFIPLSSAYLMKFGVNYDLEKSWIETSKIPVISKAEIVVSRSDRYHSPFDWKELFPWVDRAIFVGLKSEHEEFVRKTGLNIRHEVTETWVEMAGLILGSKLFIGNQSLPYALAEAVKHPRVLEVCSRCPNCDPQSQNGHVRLSQGVIRKYLLEEDFEDEVRKSRIPNLQLSFNSWKPKKEDYKNVSCVLIGNDDRAKHYDEMLKKEGIETIISNWETFEESANLGVLETTRRIICIIDCDLSLDDASVVAVIESMISTKAGMIGVSTSMVGIPHITGACFAISRDTYEKAGLFNLALRTGEAGMIEMSLRYESVGVVSRSLSIPGWTGRSSTPEDDNRNRAYLFRNFGVEL